MMDVFRPNRSVAGAAWAAIVAAWAAAILVAWLASSAFLVPTPLEVLSALGGLVAGDGLLYELWQSMKTNLEALAISAAVSLALSYLTVVPAFRPAAAVVAKARFFGLAGFVIVFTMAFGGGHGLKVALMTFGMTVFFVTSMASVVAGIPRAEYDQARSLRMGEWRIVWEVVILGKTDEAFEVMRQNAAIGWMMLTMVEGLVRSEGGVGAMMLSQSKHFHLDAVFAIQFSIFVVGVMQDFLIAWAKGLVCPYASLTLERR